VTELTKLVKKKLTLREFLGAMKPGLGRHAVCRANQIAASFVDLTFTECTSLVLTAYWIPWPNK
jgi:hypothetical protein